MYHLFAKAGPVCGKKFIFLGNCSLNSKQNKSYSNQLNCVLNKTRRQFVNVWWAIGFAVCWWLSLSFDRSIVLQYSIRYRSSFFQFIFVSVSELFILTLSHLIWMMAIANCICRSRPFCSFRSHNYTSALPFFSTFTNKL